MAQFNTLPFEPDVILELNELAVVDLHHISFTASVSPQRDQQEKPFRCNVYNMNEVKVKSEAIRLL